MLQHNAHDPLRRSLSVRRPGVWKKLRSLVTRCCFAQAAEPPEPYEPESYDPEPYEPEPIAAYRPTADADELEQEEGQGGRRVWPKTARLKRGGGR